MKLCSKCMTVHTPESWATLPFCRPTREESLLHVPADEDGPAETLELRNCMCGSTLAVVVETAVAS